MTDVTGQLVYKYAIQTDTLVLGQRNASTTPAGGSDFTDSIASFGVGTSSPWGLLSVHASSTNIGIDPLFVVGSTTPTGENNTLFVINNLGNVGIASTSPSATLSVDGAGYISGTLFVGDALYEDGNDAPVIPTGVETRQVSSPKDTELVIDKLCGLCKKIS